MLGELVAVTPLTKKMKDRVNSHGSRMRATIRYEGHVVLIDGVMYDCYLESLDKTLRVGETKTTWAGWVKIGRDCELTKVLAETSDR